MKRVKNIWEFPRIDFGDPPSPPLEIAQNYLLVFYSQLLKRVPVVLCLGALTGPRESPPPPPPLEIAQNSLILDFNCQPLRRVPICFMSVGPYGPGGVLGNFEERPISAIMFSSHSTFSTLCFFPFL